MHRNLKWEMADNWWGKLLFTIGETHLLVVEAWLLVVILRLSTFERMISPILMIDR